jgi:lysozyme
MKISNNGINFIKKHEAFRSKMYFDTEKNPTIGYGTLIDSPDEQYLLTKTITEQEATDLMVKKDLPRFEKIVNNGIKVPLAQNQYDSLVAFVYNTGTLGTGLPKLINSKASEKSIAEKFMEWNKETINGKKVVSKGLTNRRNDELDLFFGVDKKKELLKPLL